MRIALVCVDDDPAAHPSRSGRDGVGEHVGALAGALGADHDVVVDTAADATGDTTGDTEPDAAPTIRRHHTGGPLSGTALAQSLPRLVTALVRTWRLDRPDVVHAHTRLSTLAAGAAARELDLPLVLSLHGPAGRTRAEAAVIRQAVRLVVPSEERVVDLLRTGARRSAVRVVPPGIDARALTPSGAALRRGDRPRLVALGAGSGVEDLVAAMRFVPAAELLVAGDDARLARCRRAAAAAGVADRVCFLGAAPRDGIGPLIRSAEVVVDVPRHGASGVPALQAMACGRAVVATAVGALNDIVVDQVTGLHVAPGRPDELGRSLARLLTRRTRLDGFGIAGRDRVLARFGWDRLTAAIDGVLREAADRRDG